MSKFVGTGRSSYEKRIYRAAVSQRLKNTALNYMSTKVYLVRICINLKLTCKQNVPSLISI
jgi:hypothetical protein